MSTRKTDADIRREDYCHRLNEALVGTGIRVDPGEPFTVTVSRATPGDLAPLLDYVLAITGREPRSRPWRPAPDSSPEDRP